MRETVHVNFGFWRDRCRNGNYIVSYGYLLSYLLSNRVEEITLGVCLLNTQLPETGNTGYHRRGVDAIIEEPSRVEQLRHGCWKGTTFGFVILEMGS